MGAIPVAIRGSDPAPHTLSYTAKATAVTAAAALTTSDVSAYHRGMLTISGLTSETVALTRTVDAVSGLACPVHDNGTWEDGSALGNGTYVLENLSAEILTFTKSSTSEAVTITLSLFP